MSDLKKKTAARAAAPGPKSEGSRGPGDLRAYLPETALRRAWLGVPKACRSAFLGAFFLGLATHLFLFANKLPNADDLSDLYHFNTMTSSGRWFDIVAKGISGYYSAPWAIGLVSLFFLALATAFLCHLLKARRSGSALMIAGLLATYPVLASHFSYMFYADLYMVALFLSVLSIWLCRDRWWGVLPGGLCLAMALGSYQAYLAVAVVTALLSIIISCLERASDARRVLCRGLRYLAAGGLGLVLYFGIQNFLMDHLHVALTDYQSINTMGQTSLAQIREALVKAYSQPGFFYFNDAFFTTPAFFKLLYGLLLGLGGVFLVAAAGKSRLWKSPRLLIALAALALLPLGYNIIYLMAPSAALHCLMFPAYMLYLAMPVFFYEAAYPLCPEGGARPAAVSAGQVGLSWLTLAASALVCFFFFLTVNTAYLHLHLKYEVTYATELRILDRLEQLPGYESDTPVVFAGAFPNDNMSMYPYYTKEAVGDMVGLRGNLVHHRLNYEGFYLNYLGKELVIAEDGAAREVRATEEFAAMPQWPENGSVAMIQGFAVVKINQI